MEIDRAIPVRNRFRVARVRGLRASRDFTAHAAALGALRDGCRGDANVMPLLISAAQADATIWEICDVFREVWGRYRDPARR